MNNSKSWQTEINSVINSGKSIASREDWELLGMRAYKVSMKLSCHVIYW
jgi:hypothetical protein